MLLRIFLSYIYNNSFFITRWIGDCFQKVYLVHPILELKGLCMFDDCCYAGHLNSFGRHMLEKHALPPNGGGAYVNLEECIFHDITKEKGIDGKVVTKSGGDSIENADEGADWNVKPKAQEMQVEETVGGGGKKKKGGGKKQGKEVETEGGGGKKKKGGATKPGEKQGKMVDAKKKADGTKRKRETAAEQEQREMNKYSETHGGAKVLKRTRKGIDYYGEWN